MDSFALRIQMMSIQMVPFIMAVVFHEFAHGLIANYWGDATAKERGRLTLNPLPHLDFIGTILFPMINMISGIPILIGWAKPVPIDPRRFRKFRPGLFWVALAGPGMNFTLAVVSSAIVYALIRWMPQDFYLFDPFIQMALASVSLNYALGLFNLVPIPPLDGSRIIESVLPIKAARKYEQFAQYSMIILLGLLMLGAFSILSVPIRYLTRSSLNLMAYIFEMPRLPL